MGDPGVDVEQVLDRAGLLRPGAVLALARVSPVTGVTTCVTGDRPGGGFATAHTPMYAASVTKQLIGVLVARRVLAGTLDLHARLTDLLPGLPPWAEAIQVHHLIHHTSGLPGASLVLAAAGVQTEQDLTNALVLRGLGGLSNPAGPPGQEFSYSNIGYVVLAEILAGVSGIVVPDLARTSLFTPLAMSDSRLGGGDERAMPDQTRPPGTVGAGGWWTSAADLATWLDALNRHRLGSDVSELVQTPGQLDDGSPLEYAWGVTVRPSPAGTSYTHGGHWPGWTSKTVRRPATQTAVALLTNSNDVDAVSRAATDLHDRLQPL